jgi:hypothetical protein
MSDLFINRFIPLISSQPGAIPTASGLYNGELALNIADARLYTRSGSDILVLNETKDFVSSSQQVVDLIAGQNITPATINAGEITGSTFTGSFTGDGTGLTNVTAVNLDIDIFGLDLTATSLTINDLTIASHVGNDGRIAIGQLALPLAGSGLEESIGTIRISSFAAGNGLLGGSGQPLSLDTSSTHLRNFIRFEDSTGPGGIDFTYQNATASAVLLNSSFTINAGSGLTGGGLVSLGNTTTVNAGAGRGIIVNADDIELDTGSQHFQQGVKDKLDQEGVFSGSTGQFATTGSNVFTGSQAIINTTPSTNFNEGALTVAGGVGIQQNLNVGGNVTIDGVLTVTTASFTVINSDVLDIGTNKIVVNTSGSVRFGGISVFDSGSGNSGSLYWDSYLNRWILENEFGSPNLSSVLIMGPVNTSSLGDENSLEPGRIPYAVAEINLDNSPFRVINNDILADNNLIVTGTLEAATVDATTISGSYLYGTTGSFGLLGVNTVPEYPLDVRYATGSNGIHAIIGYDTLDGVTVWDGVYQVTHPLRTLPGISALDSSMFSIVTTKPYGGVTDDEYYQFVNYLNLTDYTADDNENVFNTLNYVNYSSSFSQSAAVYGLANAITNTAGFMSSIFGNYTVTRTAGSGSVSSNSTALYGWNQASVSSSINTAYAVRAQTDANVSASINTAYQFFGTTNVQSSGSIGNLYGVYLTTSGLNSGVINKYGAIVVTPGLLTGSDNTYLLMGTPTIPSGNWAIYDSSSYDSYFSGAITASAFVGDGSKLTGVGAEGFPFSGSAIITGSLLISGSGLIVSGSTVVTEGITGSLSGSASTALSSSYAATASFALSAQGIGFPFTGSAEITGSLLVLDSGSIGGVTASFFTGSFIGDGSQLTGLATQLRITGSYSGYDEVNLLTDTLAFSGSNGVRILVENNAVIIDIPSGAISSSTQIIELLPIGVVSSSAQVSTGSFSGSFQGVFTGSGALTGSLTGSLYGYHSGSANLTGSFDGLHTGSFIGTHTGSFTGSFVGDGSQLTGLATELKLSGSYGSNDVVDLFYDVLSFAGENGVTTVVTNNTVTVGLPSGAISSSGQIIELLPIGIVSSSVQISTGSFSGSFLGVHTGSFTGSFIGDGSQLTGIASTFSYSGSTSGTDTLNLKTEALAFSGSNGVTAVVTNNTVTFGAPLGTVSSSAQVSASLPPGIVSSSTQIQLAQITGTTFSASNFTFPQDVVVLGRLTAEEFHTEFVSSSIIYRSGSTKFGDTSDDIHSFTGSVFVVGPLSASSLTGSLQYSNLVGVPTGIVSSSAQINTGSFTGSFFGTASFATSASFAITASYVLPSGLPSGLVSQSSQVDITQTSGFNTFSSSLAAVDATQSSQLQSLQNRTGSYATTGSNAFVGNQGVLGNITASGFISASAFSGSFFGNGSQLTNVTAAFVEYANVLNKPTLISQSVQVDHDATFNYVVNEHIDHSGVFVNLGPGLTGGGSITSSVAINVDSGSMLPYYSSSIFSRVNGDILIDVTGSATIQPDSVALGTDTSGSYVAAISAGSGISTTGASTGENIGHTISLDTGSTHFVNGARKTISVLDTTGSSGINLEYSTGSGVISAALINSSFSAVAGSGLTGSAQPTELGSSFTFDVGQGRGIIVGTDAVEVATASAHFQDGVRSSVTASNTTGASGITMAYNRTNGSFSATLFTSSIQIGGTVINLGGTTATLTGLTNLQSTSMTGSLSGSVTVAYNVVGGANRVLYNNAVDTTTTSANLIFDGTNLTVSGQLNAATKSFMINHRKLEGKKLVYGVSEGPEHSVFVRGRLTNNNTIKLPDEWEWLVDMDTVTVQLTSIGKHQKLYLKKIDGLYITIENGNWFVGEIDCYYLVHAARKDVPKLETIIG